jgi:hypothetical protein
MSDSKMKKLVILVPRIKSSNVNDIINNQIKNILLKLRNKSELKVIWVTFQPSKIKNTIDEIYENVDFHDFNDGVEIIQKYNPDILLLESRLGINGIIFSQIGKFFNIPVVTIPGYIGSSEKFSSWFLFKNIFRLIYSKNIVGVPTHPDEKFAMLKYFSKKYFFLIRTMKKLNYNILKLIFFYPLIHFFIKTYPPVHKITCGDLNICFNKDLFEIYLKAGFPKSSIVVEGDPVFDEIFLEKFIEPKQISDKTSVLFCPTPMHEHGWMTKAEEDQLILDTIHSINKKNNIDLSLKIHPSTSSFEEYNLLLKQNKLDVPIFQKENTVELLRKYDVMITYGSTDAILEAILLKKIVIVIKIKQSKNFSRFFHKDLIKICENVKNLASLIDDSIKRKIPENFYDDFIETHIGKFDGKNSERIANLILGLK